MSISRRNFLGRGLAATAAVGAMAAPAYASQAGTLQGKKVPVEKYDVVVLGAGCAGMSCALEAALKGGKVVMNRHDNTSLRADAFETTTSMDKVTLTGHAQVTKGE